ncbi:restriction endonuclease subunit S [Veillonella sp.]|uniref:restriction endonuclease subunit S n=1 Tax=Veillonella sp. TaxID=1926307 RepID=UPI0029096F87|nr:restriction endonuclease subunit S [Veillonella sp.]MDU5294350.1 restriction endonuclease subunit S [Veillonella sp.]MDU5870191.1 restriction endonuclease subunit S [Veillonella sp.]
MSKEKRRVPKLRFPGFTEDWEQRKLESLFTKYEDKVSTPDSGYWRLGLRSHCKGTFYTYVDAGHELETTEMYRVKAGNFILNITFAWERALAVTDDEDQGKLVSHRFPQFKPNDDLVIDFFKHTLMDKRFKHHLELSSPGGAGRNKVLKVSDMLKYELLVPSIQEQNIISSFLNNVDYIITLHQRKLNNLKLKKKALLQKLFPKNGERYPELRFPGFTDAWEQRKLGEIFEYLQNNTLSRDSLNYKIPNIKNIHYGDILVKFNEILDGSNKDIPYINPDLDLSKFSKSLLRDGDVIFSDTAEDDTVGKAIELQNVNAPFILSGLHTIPCRPLIPFGKGYLGNFFNSNSYRLQIRPLVQGIKVSSISKSALKDTMIKYPKNLDEQEKIGSLFQSITKMITLHQRKLDHLQLQKKALLQQMFV